MKNEKKLPLSWNTATIYNSNECLDIYNGMYGKE